MDETTTIISDADQIIVTEQGEVDGPNNTSWRHPTPPRIARPSPLSTLSNMARRAVLKIGGVDSSVALSNTNELLLCDRDLLQCGGDLRQILGRTRSAPSAARSVNSDEYDMSRSSSGYRNAVSSDDYHTSNNSSSGYRNIVGNTVRSPTRIMFSKKTASHQPPDIINEQLQMLTESNRAEAPIMTSYSPLSDDDSSALATDKVREECNVFYDKDAGDNTINASSSSSAAIDGKEQQRVKHSLSTGLANKRLFLNGKNMAVLARSKKFHNHRRGSSALYCRDLAAVIRGSDYYCGLDTVVSWTDQTIGTTDRVITPMPSGVVDVDVSTNSTLYELNTHTGRVQIHLPKDDVRLVMDPNLEAGILCVVVTEDESKFQLYHTNSHIGNSTRGGHHRYKPLNTTTDKDELDETSRKVPPLTYILTVDDDLYKRVLNELAERWNQPCGLYFCCHETDETSRVSAWCAAIILSVILLIMFITILLVQD